MGKAKVSWIHEGLDCGLELDKLLLNGSYFGHYNKKYLKPIRINIKLMPAPIKYNFVLSIISVYRAID